MLYTDVKKEAIYLKAFFSIGQYEFSLFFTKITYYMYVQEEEESKNKKRPSVTVYECVCAQVRVKRITSEI